MFVDWSCTEEKGCLRLKKGIRFSGWIEKGRCTLQCGVLAYTRLLLGRGLSGHPYLLGILQDFKYRYLTLLIYAVYNQSVILLTKIVHSMFFASSLWYFSQGFFFMCQILCRYYIPVSIRFYTHILGVQCSITFVQVSRLWKKFVTDRHHCFKSGIIPKNEGGPIRLSFVTDL